MMMIGCRYLERTKAYGNVVIGWAGYIDNKNRYIPTHKKDRQIKLRNRIFSYSSVKNPYLATVNYSVGNQQHPISLSRQQSRTQPNNSDAGDEDDTGGRQVVGGVSNIGRKRRKKRKDDDSNSSVAVTRNRDDERSAAGGTSLARRAATKT